MTRAAVYSSLKAAVESGSSDDVCVWLEQHTCTVNHDIHAYFCTEEAPEQATSCGCSCETLLSEAIRQKKVYIIRLLLRNGACPPVELCATDYRYGRSRASTSLKRAVESGSLEDVQQLMILQISNLI